MDVGPLLLPLPEPIEVTAPHPPCATIGSDCDRPLPSCRWRVRVSLLASLWAGLLRQHGLHHQNHGHRRHAFSQRHTLDSPEHANSTVACGQGYEHRDELLVDRLSLGYLVYNRLDYAEAIVRAPTPVGPAGMRTPHDMT